MSPHTRLPAPRVPGHPCVVFGVLNVTPDSFSDGGSFLAADEAVAHGVQMWQEGADVVDVGGESTRPGAARVDAAEELRRVLPVVRGLTREGIVVSIDTMRAEVARAAADVGAGLVNDVSGGLADPEMAPFVAATGVPYVAMHWRGHSIGMASRAVYADVVAEVVNELGVRVEALVAAGVDKEQLVLDPGLGFAKEADHNWALLTRLKELQRLGRPVLVGASRKGFLGRLLTDDRGEPRPADDRDDATAALSALLALQDAWGLRVHAVRATVDALRVVGAWRSAEVAS